MYVKDKKILVFQFISLKKDTSQLLADQFILVLAEPGLVF